MGFDYRTYTGLGKQAFGGHKQNLVHTRTQEKGAVSAQETEPDLPVSVQESPVVTMIMTTYHMDHIYLVYNNHFKSNGRLLPI